MVVFTGHLTSILTWALIYVIQTQELPSLVLTLKQVDLLLEYFSAITGEFV